MAVFQCKLCHFFFETYYTGVTHLRTKHSIRARNRPSVDGGNIGSSCHEKLKAISLDRISISLRRVEQSEEQDVVPKKKPRRCNYRTVKRTKNGGVEIQLDSLKASEIETLMKDLYQNQKEVKNSKNILSNSGEVLQFPSTSRQGSSRRAAAVAADEVISNLRNGDVEVDEHDIDNLEDTKVANRKKRKAKRDQDYLPNSEVLSLGQCLLPRKRKGPRVKQIITVRKNADGAIKYEKKYACDVKGCVRKYSNLKDLQRHKELHEKFDNDTTRRHKCPLCHLKFVKKASMQHHFILHLENNPFVCKFSGCGAKFGGWEHLERHVKLHTGIRSFSCQLCTRSFARSDSLQKHINQLHSNKRKKKKRQPVKIMRQLGRTKTINDLAPDAFLDTMNHPSVTKEEKEEIRWEVESQHFTDHILLETSNTEKNEDDDGLDVEFKGLENSDFDVTNATEVSKSEASHSSVQQKISIENSIEVQPVINDGRKDRKSIRSIILNDPVYQKLLKDDPEAAIEVLSFSDSHPKGYNMELQIFKCTLCEWEGARAFFLQQHMKKLHQKDINCTASSSTASTTESNQSVTINLLCGACGYQSSSGTDLSEHIKKEHETTRKFACSFCGLRFDTVMKKDFHEKTIHLTERKFPCSKCNSKYVSRTALRQHERKKHDPEYVAPKFRCKTCGRQLGCMLSLQTHINSHRSAVRVSCKICNQSCADKHVLKRHIAYVHLNVKNPYNGSLKPSKTLSANGHPNVPPTATTTTDTPETTKCNDLIIGL